MSLQVQKHRERIAEVEYEIAKLDIKILGMEDAVKNRLKMKEENEKHKFPWRHEYQLGLEQSELQIAIYEAEKAKFINELKFLRLILQELLTPKTDG